MNHKVNNVQELYMDSENLYKNCVIGSADSIIQNLGSGIEELKKCWEGKDAGVQIQNLILVYNGMISIRNTLGALSATATKIAADYRDIQNSNGAGLETLVRIMPEDKTKLPEYSDNRDTINISQEANSAKSKVETALNSIDSFNQDIQKYFNAIMNNWQSGGAIRDAFISEFELFNNRLTSYKELLTEATNSISTALTNYGV